jgi:hypothetical protein
MGPGKPGIPSTPRSPENRGISFVVSKNEPKISLQETFTPILTFKSWRAWQSSSAFFSLKETMKTKSPVDNLL